MRPLLRSASSLSLSLAVAVTACAPSPGDPPASTAPTLEVVTTPAGSGSSVPNLQVGASGLHLSWIEPSEEGNAVRVATLADGEWSTPSTVVTNDRLFANWADFPSIAELADGGMVAHWLQRNGDERYAYGAMVAHRPANESWSEPGWLHDDNSPTEHGFVSLVPEPGGGFTAVWLDGRAFVDQEDQPATREMSVRGRRYDADGQPGPEQVLDARVCDCCQTSAARVGDHVVAVYRDRSADEVRDIKAVRRGPDGWEEPVAVADDGWMIPGCPVNGPMIVADGHRAAVAWFAMLDQAPTVSVAFTADEGASFSERLVLATGLSDDGYAVLGRVAAAWAGPDRLAVVWLEGQGEEGRLRIATIEGGSVTRIDTLASTRSARSSGFPRLARDADGLWLAWTTPDSEVGVNLARLHLAGASD